MMNRDYVFHVIWEDKNKHPYRVGVLAQLDDFFYFILKDESRSKLAYKNGFAGIPGFKTEEIYRSQELFDFFKSRVLESSKMEPCEQLLRTRGVSMIDSFSVDGVQETIIPKFKEIILEAYELQTRKNELLEQDEVEETKNSLNILDDIE